MSISDRPTVFATLFECYRPIEHYFRLLENALGVGPQPPISIRAIDAFLMHQVATYYPIAPTVVDLAADATFGASTVFWLAHPGVTRVIVPRINSGHIAFTDWRELFLQAIGELPLDEASFNIDVEIDGPGGWEALSQSLKRLLPVIFLVPETEDAAARIVPRLEKLFGLWPNAAVFLLPLGRIGSSATLEEASRFCKFASPYRLIALREMSPFFALSQLGLINRADNTHISDVLERIQQMYKGNFEFITLVEALIAATQRVRELEEACGLSSGFTPNQSWQRLHSHKYRQLCDRIRQVTRDLLPPNATVIIVSKGDDELLKLNGVRAWHFPQTEGGVYAGYYPADSAAAIAHLEALRAKGGEFLLIPRTAFWWLDYYTEFREHLLTQYQAVVQEDNVCVIYALREPRVKPSKVIEGVQPGTLEVG